MKTEDKTQVNCHKILIPKSCCGLIFNDKGYNYNHSVNGFETIRGEELILNMDKHKRVISIELLSSKQCKKPCMD